ncbi:FG-GAP repeat domain-containing protein [Nannocystis bainbridge]|uniref:VCBS repeat-containing protein n=1 Tax=Nannocystis bainbridge TaxID=2995303 RepID=A0ABT5E558_9BACT|nr:VCBS repeat-containing protein [Nannocystis bainbridge]MDC0721004.1 VCBS repeat-containing protein [Nannocystis bainbridge]
MAHRFGVGALAGLMFPLSAAPAAHAASFAAPEPWLDDFGVAAGWRVERHPRLLGDVDGDGRDDIVGFGEQGVLVALSNGDRFGEPEPWVDNYSYSNGWRVDKHPRFLVDMNADDRADIVGFGAGGVFVSLSTGSAFLPPKLWIDQFTITRGWRIDRHPRFLADVDADDRPDIVGFGNGGVHVARSTGAAFEPSALWLDDLGYEQGWRVDRNPRQVADVDADGRADVIGFGDDGVFVARAADDRFTAAALWLTDFGNDQGWRPDQHLRLLGDVDGDDRPDIVGFGASSTLLSFARSGRFTGATRALDEFAPAQGWQLDRHPRLLGDIDGDGRIDIVGFGQSAVIVAPSKQNDFHAPTPVLAEFTYDQGWRVGVHVRTLADVDGDGRRDIVGFGDAGVLVALAAD